MFMKLGASSSLATPVCPWIGSISSFKLDEDAKWWWYLKKKVFMTSAPETAFGEKEQWNIVSQLCSPLLMFSPLPPQDEDLISQIVDTYRSPMPYQGNSSDESDSDSYLDPPSSDSNSYLDPPFEPWLASIVVAHTLICLTVLNGFLASHTNGVGKRIFENLVNYICAQQWMHSSR